jgi:hypothetical protein
MTPLPDDGPYRLCTDRVVLLIEPERAQALTFG